MEEMEDNVYWEDYSDGNSDRDPMYPDEELRHVCKEETDDDDFFGFQLLDFPNQQPF